MGEYQHRHNLEYSHVDAQLLHRHGSEADAAIGREPIAVFDEDRQMWTYREGRPQVQGVCPGCGLRSLFLAREGFVTCSSLHCDDPGAADTLLHQGPTTLDLLEDEDGAPYSPKAQELWTWWETVTQADFMAGAPKIGEYTAADLEIMGVVMERWGLASPGGGGGTEASILWYILGKVARAVAAYREGRAPSEDTLHDITYYSMMARRVRATGVWP